MFKAYYIPFFIIVFFPECGGKMHLREGEFEKAHTDFFEAFKNYDESGSPRRTTCLKYLVLANMLMKSGINPFDSQEVYLEIWTSQFSCCFSSLSTEIAKKKTKPQVFSSI